MKKRFIIFVLICICSLAFITSGASAATYGALTYEISNGEVTITDCDTSVTDVEIPAEINGYPVTSIGSYAFDYCTSLTSITLPEGVTSIGYSAFRGCTSLTSITLPKGVTSIESDAFSGCSNLADVHITDLAAWCEIEFSNAPANPMCRGKNLYLNGSLVTDLVIPDDVNSVKAYTFVNCTSLTSITLPEGVTSIGESAFDGCTSLTSITLPEGVTSIGSSAFYYCTSLTSITLPEGVTSIGSSAFGGCERIVRVYISDMTAYLNCAYGGYSSNPMAYAKQLFLNGKRVKGEITLPAGVTKIPDYAFCRQAITGITIPEGVTSIGYSAFRGCTSLTSITLPEGVTSIGRYAFSNCTSLTSIMLPEGVTSIGDYAFEDCTSLTSITLPEGVTSIGSSAFQHCTSLTSVTLPEGVTSIGSYAFYNCTSLTSITLPESVTSIGSSAFYNCTSLTSVAIPADMISIDSHAFDRCTALETVYYDGTDDDWDAIYIDTGNDPLLNARRQTCVRVTLTDEEGKTQTLICEPGQPISVSQIESLYKHHVTLYTDEELTQEFEPSTVITEKLTLYVKLGEELVGATLRGQVNSYHPQRETVIRLLQNGEEKYSVNIPAEASGSGQVTQAFSIPEVAEGIYDLVVSKAGHLTFTIRGVVMGEEDLDLTANSNAAISTITLLAGDLNGDGSINTKDRTALNRNLNLAGSDIIDALADINGDDLVNSKDRTILKKNLNKSAENDCIINY